MKERFIYLDMDGVLANFNQRMIDVFGVPFDRVGDNTQHRWELISAQCPTVYADLQEMEDADSLVAGVIAACVEYDYIPAILTAIPKYGRIPDAVLHKREWVRKRWPVLTKHFKIGPYAIDKQTHAAPGDVLIDDSHLNIPQWVAVGGIGILHTDTATTLQQLFEHLEATHGNT